MSATDDAEKTVDEARAETRAAFENRALMYHYVFEELVQEIGLEQAVALMKRAIRRRGLEIGAKYREAVDAGDLETVGRIFCEGSPSGGELFEPGIEDLTEDCLVLRMTACPLVNAWRALGLPDERIDVLCEIAAAVDEGTFEGAGLDLKFRDRLGRPGSARCLLELRPRVTE